MRVSRVNDLIKYCAEQARQINSETALLSEIVRQDYLKYAGYESK